jgi:hypothetical protein
MGTISVQLWNELWHKNGPVSTVTRLNPLQSKPDRCRFYIHLISLNLRNFKMELKIIALRSLLSWMTCLLNLMKIY